MNKQSYLEVIDKNQISMFSSMFYEPSEVIQTTNGLLESQSPFNKEIKVKIIESLNTKEGTFLKISGKIYKDDIPLIKNLLNDFEILLNRK